MTAWRDMQEEVIQLQRSRVRKAVWGLGLDGAYVRGWGEKRPVLVAVDLGAGKPVAIAYLDEHNPDAARRLCCLLVSLCARIIIYTD